jgi:hypothetical protein
MLSAQRRIGGGVYGHALEHVGDLTHRIAEEGGRFGTEFVEPKVRTQLQSLGSRYGFDREAEEQRVENDRFNTERGRPGVSARDVEDAGWDYAEEHKKVPAYTRPMALARDAAVALGQQRTDGAVRSLTALQRTIDAGPAHWRRQMSQDASVRFLRES